MHYVVNYSSNGAWHTIVELNYHKQERHFIYVIVVDVIVHDEELYVERAVLAPSLMTRFFGGAISVLTRFPKVEQNFRNRSRNN